MDEGMKELVYKEVPQQDLFSRLYNKEQNHQTLKNLATNFRKDEEVKESPSKKKVIKKKVLKKPLR